MTWFTPWSKRFSTTSTTSRSSNPAFGRLQESEMIVDGLSAELHPGAVKYYKERGWM